MWVEKMRLNPAPENGTCSSCGSTEWQLVEQVQQWHRGSFELGRGFVFEGNHEWDRVSAEGDPLFLECRVCLSRFEVPEYSWA